MPSKMSSVVMLAAAAAYAGSKACTAFSAIGASSAQHAVEANLRLAQQPLGSASSSATTAIAGVCALGSLAAVATLGSARAAKRGGRASVMPRAAMMLNEQLAGTGPSTITVGKDGPSCFSNLIEALKAQGLTSVLDGPGPFTIFAPDDKAFAASGVSPASASAAVLKLHVVAGIVMQKDFKNQELTTIGGDVTMKKGRMGVSLNGQIIKKPDIQLKNGVLHIMAGVITP
mmetsp:Transcript_91115/g.231859  ORF Transcript_91115/g.231859 Transcript_91115/m.231859 type:complete len:230 (+) Transcript_91115:85-774(+)